MKDIWNSFKTGSIGLSGRKMTAFTLIGCVVALHVLFFIKPNFDLFINLVIVDLVGSAFFLGLVTISNIIELKNGNVVKSTTTTATTQTTETTKDDIQNV